MQMRTTNSHSSIGPNTVIPIGRIGAALIVGENVNENIAAPLQLDRESLSSIDWISILGALF